MQSRCSPAKSGQLFDLEAVQARNLAGNEVLQVMREQTVHCVKTVAGMPMFKVLLTNAELCHVICM